MTTGNLVEQLEHKIVMLQHDLKQTRINMQSENTRLKNQLAKANDIMKKLSELVRHEDWCDQRFYPDACNCLSSEVYYELKGEL